MHRTTFTALVIFLLGLVGCTHSQENLPSADEVLQKFGSVVGKDIPGLNNASLPFEDAKTLFKDKCTKNGGPDAFDNVQRAQVDMTKCIQSIVNFTKLQAEMEEKKPTGDLDIVFKNYCDKSPILKACITNFTDKIEHCLDEKEKESKKIILNVTDSLLEFTCYKEGDRIALFIASGGPECFQERQQGLQDCANNTYGSYLPKTDPTGDILSGVESLPMLTFGKKECQDMAKLETCVVAELEKCADPTPANIVEAVFKFIKRVTPCGTLLDAQSAATTSTQNSGALNMGTLSTVTILSTFAIYNSVIATVV